MSARRSLCFAERKLFEAQAQTSALSHALRLPFSAPFHEAVFAGWKATADALGDLDFALCQARIQGARAATGRDRKARPTRFGKRGRSHTTGVE